MTGFTSSTDFPTVSAYQPTNHGTPDAFVTKFNSNGTVAYSTYLGGAASDLAFSIAVDASGNAYVVGTTSSADFPTQNAYQTSGTGSAFLTKFNSTGSALLYSTYFGGTSNDDGRGVAIDAAGNAYISGFTVSTNFPVRNAYQATYAGGIRDAFVARLNTTLSGDASLIYSTYLGGSGDDESGNYSSTPSGHGIAVDAAGNAYVAGQTMSTNFPTRSAYDPSENGGSDAWVAKVNTNAVGDPSLIYSTYLGGSNCCDYGRDVAIDGAGNAYVTGATNSTDFPTLNAYHNCAVQSPFVTKLNPSGNALVYSTCFGASGEGNDIAVDGSGKAHVSGSAGSGFPQVNSLQAYGGGSSDAFVLRLNPAGDTLAYSTYLGGSAVDQGYGVATDGVDKTYVAGSTLSANFPVQNPYQPTCSNNCAPSDAFISVIDDAAPIATSTPTSSPIPTNTFTSTPTNTPVQPTSTRTRTPIASSTPTNTARATDTPGGATSTVTSTATSTATYTATTVPDATPTVGPTACAIQYADVLPGSDFYPYIRCLACRKVANGYECGGEGEPYDNNNDGYFRPFNNITRSQVAKMVSISAGFSEDPGPQIYADVDPTSPFFPYINRLTNHGFMSGYPCGGPGEPCDEQNDPYFRPYSNATRGQLSKIVANAAGIIDPVPDGTQSYEDVLSDNAFWVYVERLTARGVIGGYACGGEEEPCVPPENRPYFRPFNEVTRGQASKILSNTFFPDCQTPAR